MAQTICSGCGTPGSGDFCTRCGKPMQSVGQCGSCGSAFETGALYCSECGNPLGRPPAKPLRARLPWILSGLALVAFAVAISLMIRSGIGERAPGMPPSGSIIEGGQPATGPRAIDLSSMSARQAADRLFDRTMREESAGDTAQALTFAAMAVQAYSMVPAAELDADAYFHLGLLELMLGQPDAAALRAEAILAAAPDHLLGWILQERVAKQSDDAVGVDEARSRFLEALESQRAANLAEYVQHRQIIDDQAASLNSAR